MISILSTLGPQPAVSPKSIFKANDLKLDSLEGAPSLSAKTFWVSCNKLKTLKHSPKEVENYWCSSNPLTSLEGISPVIAYKLVCINTCMTSLKGIHHHIKHMTCAEFHHHHNDDTPYKITSHVLGLFKIERLTTIVLPDEAVTEIINRHLIKNVNGCNLEACADELCEAGFEEYAQL